MKRWIKCWGIIAAVYLIAATAMAVFDKNKPAAGTSLRVSNPEILANNAALETAIDADHDFTTLSTQTGRHNKCTFLEAADLGTGATGIPILGAKTVGGKAELVFTNEDDVDIQLTSGTNRLANNTWFTATNNAGTGSVNLFRAQSDDHLYFGVAATMNSTLAVTGMLTANNGITLGAGDNLGGSSTSNIIMNATKFTVDGSNGNTVIAGTLDVTLATTLSGGLAVGAADITNVGNADAAGEAVTYAQVFNSLAGANDSTGEATIGDLQLKWGKFTVSASSGTQTWAGLGLANFSNACFQVIVCGGNSSGGTTQTIQSNTPTTTSFKWHQGGTTELSPIRFFAIGR